MKGLIRNNFYNVEGSFKISILIGIVGLIAMVIGGIRFPGNDTLMSVLISGILGAFGALSGTAIQKDSTSKWNKFELTMPICRKDIIKARYISFLLYIITGALMAILSVLVFYIATGYINLERVGFGFTFGIAFAMSLPAFMTPLVLIFGTDKNEGLLMISAALGLGLFLGSSVLLSPFLDDFSNANLVFRLGYFIFSIILFVLSYMFSLWHYKRNNRYF